MLLGNIQRPNFYSLSTLRIVAMIWKFLVSLLGKYDNYVCDISARFAETAAVPVIQNAFYEKSSGQNWYMVPDLWPMITEM